MRVYPDPSTNSITTKGVIEARQVAHYLWVGFIIFWILFSADAYSASISYAATVQTDYALEHTTQTSLKPVTNSNPFAGLEQRLQAQQQIRNNFDNLLKTASYVLNSNQDAANCANATLINPIDFSLKNNIESAQTQLSSVLNLASLAFQTSSTLTNPKCYRPYTSTTSLTMIKFANLNFTSPIFTGTYVPNPSGIQYDASVIVFGQIYISTTDSLSFGVAHTGTGNWNVGYVGLTIDEQQVIAGPVSGGCAASSGYSSGPVSVDTPGWHNIFIGLSGLSVFDGPGACTANQVGISVAPLDNIRTNAPIDHSFDFDSCWNSAYHVDPATGNFCEYASDLSLASAAGSSLALNVIRNYNSLDDCYIGYFGSGWHSSYDMHLITATDTFTGAIKPGAPLITVYNPNGRRDEYRLDKNNIYTPPSRANAKLITDTVNGSTVFSLTTAEQITYSFNVTGQLTTISDRNSNKIVLDYTSLANKLLVTDTVYNRVLTFTLMSRPGNVTLITGVTDGVRSVSYTYDPVYPYLTQVLDVLLGTTKYDYDVDTTKLNKITDQKNQTIVENTYYTNTGQVKTTTLHPNPITNYTAQFTYSLGVPGNVTSTVKFAKTTVTDALNHVTTFAVNPSLRSTEIIDAMGYVNTIKMNGNERVTTLINPKNIQTSTSYNKMGRITSAAVAGISPVSAIYNSNNDPTQITDTLNHLTTIGYTPDASKVQTVTDQLGNITSYSYDSYGRVIQLSAPGGMVTNYHYNTLGLPDYMTRTYNTLAPGNYQPSQKVYTTKYDYTREGWLSYESDPYEGTTAQSAVTYGYDKMGRVLTITNQLNQQTINHYDPVGNLTDTTNFLGQTTQYDYDQLKRLLKITYPNTLYTTYSYDALGNVINSTDTGGVSTSAGYDNLNRLVSISLLLKLGGLVKTDYAYDGVGNVITITNRNTTSYSSDQVTAFSYDGANRLLSATGNPSNPSNSITRNYTYDNAGNITQFTQSGSNASATTLTNYDNLNRPLDSTIQGVNLTTRYSYNDTNNIRIITDSYGIRTVYQSDAAGHLISTTVTPASTANGETPQTTYNYYDARGLLIRTINPGNNQTDYGYDAIGRITSTIRYTGTLATGTPLTTLITYTDQAQPQVTTTGPAPFYQKEVVNYDQLNRPLNRTISGANDPTSLTTSYTYDNQGNISSVTDPLHTTNFDYDNTGWLLAVHEPGIYNGTSSTYHTYYQYDLVGNLITVTNAANSGYINSYRYDALARLTDEYDGLSNHWATGYDALNRVISRSSNASGQPAAHSSTYSYDEASRLKTITSTAPGISDLITNYYYGNGSQPTSMQDQMNYGNSYTTGYNYDGFERPITVTFPVILSTGLVTYGYDNLNRRTQLKFGPDSTHLKTVNYSYDGIDRPVTITDWNNLPLTYKYNGDRLDKLQYPNNVTATYQFDGPGRLTGITHTQGTNNIFFSANYKLDGAGNRTIVTETLNGLNRKVLYSYDTLSRLITENQAVGTTNGGSHIVTSTYQYDAYGNRTALVTNIPPTSKGTNTATLNTSYVYNQANQLTSRSEIMQRDATSYNQYVYNYTYDENGNLIKEDNTAGTNAEYTSYGYDARSRLAFLFKKKSTTTLSSASFLYNGNDQRLQMSYSTNSTQYIVDGIGGDALALQEIDYNTGGRNSFLYAPGSTSPLYEGRGSSPSYSDTTGWWYHADGLGSVRALTANNGAVVNTNSYNAFGQTTGSTGKADNHHLFAGEQQDPTGLYYLRARYYNPALGRFISRDSEMGQLNDPLTQNRFVYTGNNPTSRIDPSGHDWSINWLISFGQQATKAGIDTITNIGVWVWGASKLIQNNFDTNRTAAEISQEAKNDPGLAANINLASQMGYKRAISDLANLTPGLGEVKGLAEGVAGQDLVTGEKLDPAQQALSFGLSAFAFVGTGAGVLRSVRSEGGFLVKAEGSALRREVGGARGEIGAVAGSEARAEARGEAGASTRAASSEAEGSGFSEAAGAACANSFSPETPVATSGGEKSISEIKVGDKVLAYDEATGETSPQTVQAVYINDDPAEVFLTIDGEKVETTPEHPWYTEDKGWVNAGNLRIGEHIRKADGNYGDVQSLEVVHKQKIMYNLTVEKAHTFFVGQQQWLVHNIEFGRCNPGRVSELNAPFNQEIPTSSYATSHIYDRYGNLIHTVGSGGGNPYGGSLAPEISRRLQLLPEIQYNGRMVRSFEERSVDALNCAECRGVNEALLLGYEKNDLMVVTYRSTTGELMAPCYNCAVTTSGVKTPYQITRYYQLGYYNGLYYVIPRNP